MANIGMFNIPNFLGGSSVSPTQGLSSAGLGGSSGSLVDPFGGGSPQGKEIGAAGTGVPGTVGLNDPCTQSLLTTGQPTPCPPGQQHDPPGSCGPCVAIGTPANLEPIGLGADPGTQVLQEQPSGCPEPTSPRPGKPGQHTWNTVSCSWEQVAGITPILQSEEPQPPKLEKPVDILSGMQQYGKKRGAVSRQEYGQFGRVGGGVGGGSMSDLEVFDNPLLAGGSPYLGKNVSQFAYGGKMKRYDYGGKAHNPYKSYPDGGRADFLEGIRKGMNSAVAAGQVENVIRNNRASRRFTTGGKF